MNRLPEIVKSVCIIFQHRVYKQNPNHDNTAA